MSTAKITAAFTSPCGQRDDAKRPRADLPPTDAESVDDSLRSLGSLNQQRISGSCQALLCGLRAVNSVFRLHGKAPIERSQMDEVNVGVAAYEATLRNDCVAACTHLQPAGNYALDVIAAALHAYGGLSLGKTSLQPDGLPLPGIYLVGDGHHWQVLFARANGQWGRCDGPAFPLSNCADFVRHYTEQGVLLRVLGDEPAAPYAVLSADNSKTTARGAQPRHDSNRTDIQHMEIDYAVGHGGVTLNAATEPRSSSTSADPNPAFPHVSASSSSKQDMTVEADNQVPLSMEVDTGSSSEPGSSPSTALNVLDIGDNLTAQFSSASSVTHE